MDLDEQRDDDAIDGFYDANEMADLVKAADGENEETGSTDSNVVTEPPSPLVDLTMPPPAIETNVRIAQPNAQASNTMPNHIFDRNAELCLPEQRYQAPSDIRIIQSTSTVTNDAHFRVPSRSLARSMGTPDLR